LNIELLIPYENNPRNNDKAVEAVANSIKEFGFKVPIIIDKNNVIVAGHTRLKAAKKLGLKDVPVIVADDLTDDQIKAFRLADNKTGEIATWNDEMLLEELKNINFDMTMFNFEEPLDLTFDEEEFNVDEAVESITTPVSKRGEIWLLGEHKLMCGDSTTDDVLTLMSGKQADLYLSDPPYNVAVSNSQGMTIENDDMCDSEFKEFLSKAFYQVERVLKVGGSFYVFHADTESLNFRTALLENGLPIKQNLIWVKNQFILGRQDYQWQHEPCLYGWKEGSSHYFTKNRKQASVIDDSINVDLLTTDELRELVRNIQTSVLNFDKPSKNTDHPTMKPLPLIERLIRNSSRKNQIVLDTFGGSGTTLIASEKLNRKCYMVEYDPKYVDVIIHRYEELTGKAAVKL
jgi:site-specific DNA-methyltransferase (adenine-specific)